MLQVGEKRRPERPRTTRLPATKWAKMASAFNAMQAGYQRVVGIVAQSAAQLDEGAERLAGNMRDVRHGMLEQQSETEQAATAINEMSATVHHIAEHTADTRDQSKTAEQLTRSGQQVVNCVALSISGLSSGVQQTAQMIGTTGCRQPEDRRRGQ